MKVAQKEPFEIDSWVVYPSHGVGKLESIESFDIDGQNVDFFAISFPKNKLTLKIPKQKALEAGLRNVISKGEMQEALAILCQKIKKKKQMWSKRAQEYESKINSGKPFAIAEVIRDLYKVGGDASLSFSERQIFQVAVDRLARELSIIEDLPEEDAVKKLDLLLQAA
ncbi:hypothetical protein FACS1894113_4880 [Alphaproteobacteria bacterium]|nr:hypothetical protein FACS1894113_4880 [Alphaproteobacteria bacterium]